MLHKVCPRAKALDESEVSFFVKKYFSLHASARTNVKHHLWASHAPRPSKGTVFKRFFSVKIRETEKTVQNFAAFRRLRCTLYELGIAAPVRRRKNEQVKINRISLSPPV